MAKIPLSQRQHAPTVVREPRGDVGGAGAQWRAVAQASQALGGVAEKVSQYAEFRKKKDDLTTINGGVQRKARVDTFNTLADEALREAAQQKGADLSEEEAFAVNKDLRDALDDDLKTIYPQIKDKEKLAEYTALDAERNGTYGAVSSRVAYENYRTKHHITTLGVNGSSQIAAGDYTGAMDSLESVRKIIGEDEYIKLADKFKTEHQTYSIGEYSRPNTIDGLKESYALIDDDDSINDPTKVRAQEKNKRKQTALLGLKDDQQKDNYATFQLMKVSGGLTVEHVLASASEGEGWDGPADKAGTSISQTASLLTQLDNDEKSQLRLLKTEEREARAMERTIQNEKDAVMRIEIQNGSIGLLEIETAYNKGEIRHDQYYSRRDQLNREKDVTIQMAEILEPLQDDIGTASAKRIFGAELTLDDTNTAIMASTLTGDQKASALRLSAQMYSTMQDNPTTAPQIRKAVSRLLNYTADAIELGVSDDLTSHPMDFVNSFKEGATSEVIETNLQLQIDSMKSLIENVTLKKMEQNNPLEKTPSPTRVATKKDAEGVITHYFMSDGTTVEAK